MANGRSNILWNSDFVNYPVFASAGQKHTFRKILVGRLVKKTHLAQRLSMVKLPEETKLRHMMIKLTLVFFILFMGYPSYAGIKSDVLEVKGKAVVFFSPAENEYNSLSEDEKNEWIEVLSDFCHYRDKTIPYLESNHIKPIITADAKIKIHTGTNIRTFARKRFKHIVGYILTDGNKEPKVVGGVGTDVDLIADFKEYFKI